MIKNNLLKFYGIRNSINFEGFYKLIDFDGFESIFIDFNKFIDSSNCNNKNSKDK